MKKQPRDTLELDVDRGPRQAATRRKARDAFINALRLNPLDDNAINQEISKRIKRAKWIRDRVEKQTNPEKYQFLSEVMAVYLLASEPISRRRMLQRFCIKEGAVARSNTRLLHLVVKALGRSRERREAHRDSMAMEYAMVKGETPSTLVSYFNKAGQGLDATYRRAVEYFMGRNRRAPKDITEEPKAQQQSQSVPIGISYFGYFINTETGRVLKNCITEPSLVKAMVNLVEREIWRETSSSTKSPGIASREAQRVIGKRPALQSQAYSASLPGPRAKSPPYRQGS